VDELRQLPYLSAVMMRRHLLTLFALFTGLAALHAPAHAGGQETVVCDARASARTTDNATVERCVCKAQSRTAVRRCPARARPTYTFRLPEWLRPPVIFGSERALE
jgi:hypothetical protein